MIPAFWRELPEIVDGISDDGVGAGDRALVDRPALHRRHGSVRVHQRRRRSPATATPRSVVSGPTSAWRRSRLQDSFTALERARVPVIAAVQGGCIGGGVDMVSACDLRYATTDAFFCIQEINIGMTADLGTLQRLPKLIPEASSASCAYTGRRMPAERAYEVGLVNGLYDTHERPGRRRARGGRRRSPPARRWRSGAPRRCSTTPATTRSRTGSNYIATWQTGHVPARRPDRGHHRPEREARSRLRRPAPRTEGDRLIPRSGTENVC